MNSGALSVYLNDHLAGSVAALDLMDHPPDLSGDGSAGRALAELRREIAEDQEALRDVMRRLEIRESPLRKAAAWAGEKAVRVKLALTGAGKDEAGGLQALEALFLAVTGKSALWRTLRAVAGENDARLKGVDWTLLQTRAEDHCARVEALRMAAAERVLNDRRSL